MGTTPNGFPYPEPTDPVAQGADAIRDLATAVDTSLRRSAAGTAVLPLGTAQAVGTVAVTLPAGRFTAPPSVVLGRTSATSFGALPQLFWAQSVTITGFVAAGIAAVTATTLTCQWIAVQS
jgi:hypothetical protein